MVNWRWFSFLSAEFRSFCLSSGTNDTTNVAHKRPEKKQKMLKCQSNTMAKLHLHSVIYDIDGYQPLLASTLPLQSSHSQNIAHISLLKPTGWVSKTKTSLKILLQFITPQVLFCYNPGKMVSVYVRYVSGSLQLVSEQVHHS